MEPVVSNRPYRRPLRLVYDEACLSPEDAFPAVVGLTNPRSLGLERSPIRTRGSSLALSAWRMAVACEEGTGTIVLLEGEQGQTLYRGEGIFLGWPVAGLEAAYRALLPPAPEPEPDPGPGG
jgi:hypothetical protein